MKAILYNEVRKLSILMIILAISLMAAGNDTTTIKIYEGKIIDSETKQPIVFANVYVSGTSIGTVSNSDGEFILKVPIANFNDNVSIAYIGYKTYEGAISKLDEKNNLFKLNKDPFAIKEVIIRTDDPLKLLKMALNKVNENYVNKPSMLTAFYRETIKLLYQRLYYL